MDIDADLKKAQEVLGVVAEAITVAEDAEPVAAVVMEKADEALRRGGVSVPKVLIGLALAGVAVAAAVAVRRSRTGRIAVEEHVIEQQP